LVTVARYTKNATVKWDRPRAISDLVRSRHSHEKYCHMINPGLGKIAQRPVTHFCVVKTNIS